MIDVRIAPYPIATDAMTPAAPAIGIAIADPALAAAVSGAIATAIRDTIAATLDAPSASGNPRADSIPLAAPTLAAPTIHIRARKTVARRAAELAGAIAIVPITPRNARHLVELIDQLRAAGVAGIQIVWDGTTPLRIAIEHHVFAALERARATPTAAPVILAADSVPAAALRFLIAHRDQSNR